MWVRLVVCLHPPIETGLQRRSCSIDLFPECHTIALIQHGLVEPFTDPIGLGKLRRDPRVGDVLHGQMPFLLMAAGRRTTGLSWTGPGAMRR